MIIFAVARLLLHPAQSFIFSAASRLEVFLFLAAFMDIFSRTAGIITELSEKKDKEGIASLRMKTLRTIRGLF